MIALIAAALLASFSLGSPLDMAREAVRELQQFIDKLDQPVGKIARVDACRDRGFLGISTGGTNVLFYVWVKNTGRLTYEYKVEFRDANNNRLEDGLVPNTGMMVSLGSRLGGEDFVKLYKSIGSDEGEIWDSWVDINSGEEKKIETINHMESFVDNLPQSKLSNLPFIGDMVAPSGSVFSLLGDASSQVTGYEDVAYWEDLGDLKERGDKVEIVLYEEHLGEVDGEGSRKTIDLDNLKSCS
ncbi:MAG: hypothetical protein SVV03_02185 [Candidatus Nanohaloarchaea archaeon]|nr:hypothetical protein [Candidatus Nanohaloarchaea archaeon]